MRHLAFAVAAALLAVCGTAGASPAPYSIDPTHTFVTIGALHFGTSTTRGRFATKEDTIEFDRAGRAGKVDITIDMTSISTGVPPFDSHLKSKDFFDVGNHPTARFVASGLSFDGNNVAEVKGLLTMLGKTAPVVLKASRFICYQNPIVKREVCGGDLETTLQRRLWGSTYGLPGIPDNLRLLVQVGAFKQ